MHDDVVLAHLQCVGGEDEQHGVLLVQDHAAPAAEAGLQQGEGGQHRAAQLRLPAAHSGVTVI